MSEIFLKPNFQKMPSELKERPQWVVWKLVPDADKNGNPKPRKTPVDPKTGKNAKANDPSTWATYDRAIEYYLKHAKDVAGIGYEFSADDPYVGIDLDKAVNGEGPLPWAMEIIRELDSYTEFSPSMTGYHILVRGRLPPGRRKNGQVEMYQEGRFFTMTGEWFSDSLGTIQDRKEQLEKLHAKYVSGNGGSSHNKPTEGANVTRAPATPLDEVSILKRAGKARNGAKFSRLWVGDISGHNSHSDADLALCNMLAFWTRKDPVLMDSLFRQSGLMREKWDKVHRPADGATYGAMTIQQAIADCRDVYEGPRERESRPKSAPKITEEAIDGFPLTEDGIALAFTERFRNELRYCHHAGAWFHWDGNRWKREETRLAFSWARSVCREMSCNLKNARVRAAVGKAATAASVERFAQADRAFAVTSEIWDRDHWLLGTPQGVVDLRTGELRSARQSDCITKQTSIAPTADAKAPLWLQFLDETTKGDQDLQRFIQQMTGYCLTGDVSEHALFFVYGPGGNGKSVFLSTVMNIVADYARTAALDSFTASRSDRHPTDLAMLRGARLVSVSETEEGRTWAESRIKQLTGGDKITARFMRQDFFEYRPQFKLLIIGNHKPVLRNVDDAARRRFNIIPFVHKPDTPDKQLEMKLRAEYPAILRWMIEGCLDWRKNGLVRPTVVTETTQAYLDDQDLFRQWIEECCEVGPDEWETTSNLFASWRSYAERSGERPGSMKAFSANLSKHEFTADRNKTHRFFKGISLIPQRETFLPYAD